MKPCTTSALARRKVTGLPAGTTRQFGINAYCCATTCTTAEPSGAITVPRLASENSPPLCSEVESIVSTCDGGCQPQCTLVYTTTTTSRTMIAVTKATQSRSLASARLSPEGGSLAVPLISANWTSRQESEEIECKPDRDHDRYCGHGHDHRSPRHFREHLCKFRLVYFVVGSHLDPPRRSMSFPRSSTRISAPLSRALCRLPHLIGDRQLANPFASRC